MMSSHNHISKKISSPQGSATEFSGKAANPRPWVTVASSSLLIICLATSILFLRLVDHVRPAATLEEVLYITSPRVLRRLSLGYDGLLADIYWTRVVQYYGGKHRSGGGRYELLWPLLNVTSHLDPHLIATYEFGGTFLATEPPNGAGLPQEALRLVEYGIQNNPEDWRLYYDLGFIYYEIKDYRAAADAFLRGSHVPNAHPFLRILAARMAEHGGEIETARTLWTASYQATRDQTVRNTAAAHLRALRADEEITHLQPAVDAYQRKTGHVPRSFIELVKAGWLPAVPVDPLDHEYRIEETGRVVVSSPGDLPFLEQGLPSGYTSRARFPKYKVLRDRVRPSGEP